MERVTHSLGGRIREIFHPGAPDNGYSLRFHIPAGIAASATQGLLLDEESEDIGFNSKTARQLLAARVARFKDNDRQARLLQSEGHESKVVISGEGGTYNALVLAEAITSSAALPIFRAESVMIADARRYYNGGMFSALVSKTAEERARIELIEGEFTLDAGQSFYIGRGEKREEVYVGVHTKALDFNRYIMVLREIVPGVKWSAIKGPEAPLGTPLIEPYLKDFKAFADGLTIVEPQMAVIGGRGNILTLEEIRQEIVRQTFLPYDKQQVDDALKLLGIPQPVEIGLEPMNKYKAIGGVLAGVAVVSAGGFLVRKAYKRNKKRS